MSGLIKNNMRSSLSVGSLVFLTSHSKCLIPFELSVFDGEGLVTGVKVEASLDSGLVISG